jgi:hypothetical protein
VQLHRVVAGAAGQAEDGQAQGRTAASQRRCQAGSDGAAEATITSSSCSCTAAFGDALGLAAHVQHHGVALGVGGARRSRLKSQRRAPR